MPTGADQRLFDLGKFQIGTSGFQQTSQVIGELWVTYDVLLFKPILVEATGQSINMEHYRMSPSSLSTIGAGTDLLGTVFPIAPQDGSSIGTTLSSGGVVSFPPLGVAQSYYVQYQCSGSSTVLTNFVALTLGAGVTARPILKAGTTSIVNIPAGTTSSVQHFVQYINVSASTTARTITFTAGTPPTSPTTCDLVICQVDPDVATLKRRALPAPKR